MLRINLLNLTLICVSTFLMSLGQLFWKLGLAQVNKISIFALFNFHLIIGFIAYFFATAVWLYLLRILPLSLLYPFTALSFVFGYILAYFVLGEPIQVRAILGLILIALGLLLIAK